MITPIPLSLYIHFPWCVQKCPYCDFNSHAQNEAFNEQAYIQALLRDLDFSLPLIWGRPIHTIFMGGGTPSLFSADAIDELISGLRARLNLSTDIEITMEANPGTADSTNFAQYFHSGINRLSIGMQSMDNQQLKSLGRIHQVDESLQALEMARQAGFENINLDLMFGLPGQSMDAALDDLQQIIKLKPAHISYYQLTIEPNTWFHHHPPVLPDDDALFSMHQAGIEMLARNGYQRYEISAFAQSGRDSKHNMNYWRFGDYLGIGAGAHSKLSMNESDTIIRMVRQKHPQAYLDTAGTRESLSSHELVSIADRPFEFMMNALRLIDGVEMELFTQRTMLELAVTSASISQAQETGLLLQDNNRIQASTTGLNYLNNLLELFLPK